MILFHLTASWRLMCLLLLVAPAAVAQTGPPPGGPSDSRLPGLLAERAALTRQYAEASAQRHSLFGNKPSKKDLQEVVDALQGIVDKDQQMVDVLNQTAQQARTTTARLAATTTHLESSSRDDRNLTSDRLAEIQNELDNQHAREKQLVAHQRDLEADVAEAKQGQFVRDALIGVLALACIGLVLARRRGRR
ncbi:MAG: MICOS complex subunit MIC26/MIC27 [Bacteroidota bacterium]|nr:MICOS complex subunit MIC26/MIC27 [Bacteroidota bacterium]